MRKNKSISFHQYKRIVTLMITEESDKIIILTHGGTVAAVLQSEFDAFPAYYCPLEVFPAGLLSVFDAIKKFDDVVGYHFLEKKASRQLLLSQEV